jgi:hypothetical protein
VCLKFYYRFLESFRNHWVHVASLDMFLNMFIVFDTERLNTKVMFVTVLKTLYSKTHLRHSYIIQFLI